MRLLDRYLLRELLIPLGYCLGGFFIFWISFDLIGRVDYFDAHRLRFADVVEYYAIRTPELLVMILPIGFLLALLYTLTNHARHHELTAIRTAGVSLWRIAVPYLAFGVLLGGAVFALNEWWAPDSAAEAEAVVSRYVAGTNAAANRRWETRVGFTNTREQRKWFIAAFNVHSYELINPHIDWTLPDGLRKVIIAERGAWTDQGWVFTNVQVTVYPAERGADPGPPFQTNVMAMTELTEMPEQIKSEIKVSKITSFKESRNASFSIREILAFKRLHSDQSDKVTMMNTHLQALLAAPWTCVVVVLIALPFGAQTGRRNVFVGVASSIVICFGYFVLQQLSLAVGTRGTLPPWLAAWAPNTLFALMGIGMTWRIR